MTDGASFRVLAHGASLMLGPKKLNNLRRSILNWRHRSDRVRLSSARPICDLISFKVNLEIAAALVGG